MYHCHIHFYLAGQHCRAFELMKEMAPLEYFTYEFTEEKEFEELTAGQADVILANLQNIDAGEAAAKLLSDRREGTELILIAEKEQFMHLPEDLSGVKDIWMMPMSEA